MSHRLFFFLGILPAVSLLSCQKHNGSQQCNLAMLVDSTTSVQSVTSFSYDAQGRLSSAVVSGQKACVRTFQYIGNAVIFNVSDTTPGIQAETDTMVLNSQGLMITQASHYTSSGASSLVRYVYDDGGNPLSSTETDNGAPGDSMVYSYSNGNLSYEAIKGQSVHKTDFTYYPTLGYVYGDPTDFRQLLYYGAYYYKNKNMLSVLSYPGSSYKNYTYTFAGNRIAMAVSRQWSSSSADTVTHYLRYSYSCQ